MKKDEKTMTEVAKRCTRFSRDEYNGCCGSHNSTSEENVCCNKCRHYNATKVCDLDLYTEIVKNHNL